jgi:glycosyltransferase involved in cell wall biosynthesis
MSGITTKTSYRYLVIFNNQLVDGCDYAYQTLMELERRFPGQVVGWALAESVPWWRVIQWWRPLKLGLKWAGVPLLVSVQWLPGQRWQWVKQLNLWLSAWWWRWRLGAEQTRPTLWAFEPFTIPLIAQVFRKSPLLYDSVDDWAGLAAPIQKEHQHVLERAKWLAVNSAVQWQRYQQWPKPVVHVPLGCAVELFLALPLPAKLKSLSKSKPKPKNLVFGYVGQVGTRINVPWLRALAMAWPQHEFRLVGPRQNWQMLSKNDHWVEEVEDQLEELLALPNVHWSPGQPKAAMPAIISEFDVGLIPYNTQQHFNLACHPMKLYEYFAAGKPVVATGITELERYQKQGLLLANDQADPIIHQFPEWYQQRPTPMHLRKIAQTQSWEEKVGEILRFVAS